MTTHFTKMHGLGNDFIVINNLDRSQEFPPERIRMLANRQFGVGFDQMLVVEKPSREDVEFDYRIFNYDGSEVEHCGNGARCFAVYVRDQGLTTSEIIPVNTCAGKITLHVREDRQVTVEMGVPEFTPSAIPFVADRLSEWYSLKLGDEVIEVGAVAIGNPHVVMLVEDVDTAPVDRLGPLMEKHQRFPNRVNVGFMQILDRGHIRLRVHERGVGETRACGTGACAAHVIGCKNKLLDKSAVVTLPGGDLHISWPGENHNVEMTGPCTTVFEGHTEM